MKGAPVVEKRPETVIEKTLLVADRGPRPLVRGWLHAGAALLSLIVATVLATFSWMTLAWWQALGVNVYCLGLVVLFGVSAAYHLIPWRSPATVAWWRRADHAVIAVFIAATYTPMLLIVTPDAWWMLLIAWVGAAAAAVLNLAWIEHPRALDVVVYLSLGWLIIPLIPQVWSHAGAGVVWLLFAGGVIYSLGALVYGFKWPGRNARWFGYHEHFHAATVVAAAIHLVAMWIVVAR
ncbi:membrane protein [Corynebacterium phocae]|uniref:Membrane protein n=1 Tax=Corynebacterium phocae TaxID=161895 RepID=A0A1L7D6N9_9CORY|nr:membrane protein [Corynebacterium phocae]